MSGRTSHCKCSTSNKKRNRGHFDVDIFACRSELMYQLEGAADGERLLCSVVLGLRWVPCLVRIFLRFMRIASPTWSYPTCEIKKVCQLAFLLFIDACKRQYADRMPWKYTRRTSPRKSAVWHSWRHQVSVHSMWAINGIAIGIAMAYRAIERLSVENVLQRFARGPYWMLCSNMERSGLMEYTGICAWWSYSYGHSNIRN